MTDIRPFRVIIVGGGIAGLTLANSFQAAGTDYVLLEARNNIAPQVGASIAILPNGARIMDQLGCWDDIDDLIEPLHSVGEHYANGDYIGPRSDLPMLSYAR